MPKLTRKYPSKKKTTTVEGYREYKKLQMRDYRKRKKALKWIDSLAFGLLLRKVNMQEGLRHYASR